MDVRYANLSKISNNSFVHKTLKRFSCFACDRLKTSSNVPVVRSRVRLPLLKVFKFGVSICIVTVRLGRCSGGPTSN